MEQNNTQVEETQQASEQQDETQQEAIAQQEPKPLKEEIKQQVRKYKLKINGQERQVDEKTVLALAQKNGAADEKFQKAAERQRKLDTLISLAKKDPDAFIREVIGEDAVEFSKKRLARQLEELSLDPKQKELREYKRKVEQYQAEKKAEQQRAQKAADEKAVQHWTQHYDKVLPDAIKGAGLPLTEDVIRYATDIMIANLEEGFDLPMQAVMDLTKDRYLSSVKKFLTAADKERLSDLLGQDVVKKLGIATGKKPVQRAKTSVQSDKSDYTSTQQTEQERMRKLEQRIKKWQSQ